MTCEWPVDRGCLPDLPDPGDDTYDAKVAQRNHAENTAIAVLWALSGRQYSCTELTVRPEPRGWQGMCDAAPLIEAYYRNDFRGVTTAQPSPLTVKLEGPVYEIIDVTVDGVVLDEAEYALENDTLFRIGKAWPRNDMSKPAGYPGTWSVTYVKGQPPPEFVGTFVGQLAAEMIGACESGKCKLPRTVISTSRSGVTHVFDPTRMLRAGFTGLPNVDTWLASVNPHGLASTARIR
jgi:hypothetical protein